jgi:hypothetical protein
VEAGCVIPVVRVVLDGVLAVDVELALDVSVVDTSVVDTSVVDAFVVDASVVDTSVVDASVVGTSVVDASVVDTSVVDVSVVDASVISSVISKLMSVRLVLRYNIYVFQCNLTFISHNLLVHFE